MSEKRVGRFLLLEIDYIHGKKQLIMEVYLNVIELRPGIYGAGASSQYYYHKPAKKITRRKSVPITACFPDPLIRNPAKLTDNMQQRADEIERISSLISISDWLITSDK